MSGEWRWADPTGQQRSIHMDELRAALVEGVLAPNTPVWRPGWREWQPAHAVPELTTSALAAANGVVPNIPPPPLAMVAVQHAFEAESGVTERPDSVEEPPPPPHYVPLPTAVHAAVASSSSSSSQRAAPAAQIPLTMKTEIGLNPAAMLAELNHARKAAASKPPVPAATPSAPATVKALPDPSGDELSGSLLLDDLASNPDVGGGSQPNLARTETLVGGIAPAPSNPGFGPGPFDLGADPGHLPLDADASQEREINQTGLGLSMRVMRAVEDLRRRNRFAVPVLGVLAAMVAITGLALIVSAVRGNGDAPTTSSSSSPSSSSSSSSSARAAAASAAITPSSSVAPPEPVASSAPSSVPATAGGFGKCVSGGGPHVLAPRANVAVGTELVAIGGTFYAGLAVSPKEALAVELRPGVFSASRSAKAKSKEAIKRVLPLVVGGKLVAHPDVERPGDALTGRRAVAARDPFDIGVHDGQLSWAPLGKDSVAKLTPVEGVIDALRAAPLPEKKGYAIAYRRGNSIGVAIATGDSALDVKRTTQIASLGTQIGSPTVAASGDTVMVAFADRANAQDPWTIRLARWAVTEADPKVLAFTAPPGGLGGKVMSPSLSSIGGGRYLLAWSEGPAKSNQVRAVVIGTEGAVSGDAFAASAEGVNAGQPQVVVSETGEGAIAFMSEKGKRYEAVVVPVHCTP